MQPLFGNISFSD